jgi:hypothetical protein
MFLANASSIWVTDLYTFGDAGVDFRGEVQVRGSPSDVGVQELPIDLRTRHDALQPAIETGGR